MSIWSKPVRDITFADIEAFCLQKEREGVVIDYKQEIPRDLQKYVSAFANTSGGMLLFGVATDEFNVPIWPPVGMTKCENFTAAIAQKCGSTITPPIMPNVGELIDNPHTPGTKLAVVRVDQSGEAPHAIDSGRLVYVRAGDTSKPFNVAADVTQLERMFQRREVLASKVAWLFDRHYARFNNFVGSLSRGIGTPPTIYLHVCPIYPSSKLCALDDCIMPGCGLGSRGADGAWGLEKHVVRVIDDHTERSSRQLSQYTGATIYGDYFVAQKLASSIDSSFEVRIRDLLKWLFAHLLNAQTFLRRDEVANPGTLRIRLGLRNVLMQQLTDYENELADFRFPDEAFDTEVSCSYEELVRSDFTTPKGAPRVVYELMAQLAHAFDVSITNLISHGII